MSIRFLLTITLAALALACGGSSSPTAPSANVPYSQTDLRLGTGTEATVGRLVTVNYTGWLYDANAAANQGRLFDTSLQAGRGPFSFVLGARSVIAGWDRGVAGMRVGGLRRLVIPPDLGYGSAGSGGTIPGNATLLFEVEVLAVQ